MASIPLNVLIAEDNPVNQLLIAALVRRLGHGAICVENGRLAVEAAAATPFDCILMDMQMPEMDGIAATRAIRNGGGPNAAVPIIALTADAAPERRRFYDNVGLTEFLTKPISVDALRRHLLQIASQPASRATHPVGEPPIDPERLAELRLVLGPAKTGELIGMFEAELASRPAAIRKCAALDDLPAMRAEAHSLLGAVGSFGASGVERAAKALETASLGAECEIALARLDREVASARDALARLTASDRSAPGRRSA